MKLSKLKKDNILVRDFENLSTNNIIEFSRQGIAVIYGPNGTGKTTLAEIFGREPKTEYEIEHEGEKYTSKSELNLFHNIKDQNGRNIIEGETQDFILGDNIRKEYELKTKLETGFNDLFESILISRLKNEFGISKKKSDFLDKIKESKIIEFISDLANKQSRGKSIDRDLFLKTIGELTVLEVSKYNEEKYTFLINDYKKANSIIKKIEKIGKDDIKTSPGIQKIDESDEALRILEKYNYLEDCLICERDIDRDELIQRKLKNKDEIIQSIDPNTKKILEEIVDFIPETDPFLFKENITNAIKNGNFTLIEEIKSDIKKYFDIYSCNLINMFAQCLTETKLDEIYREYLEITKDKQIFTHEDAMYIERFVNDSLDRKIELKRDVDGNLNLLLGDKQFLNKDRTTLGLSNGEQNFISLSFELLKAQKVENPIIILDDPISSFDSIYKNKIAYAIIKFLSKKKQIILTHSLDLIRLLEHQQPNSYTLYLMNNTLDEENGFIKISQNEHNLLLYLNKVLHFFRTDIGKYIKDEKKFLISIVPFMRGYAQIIDKTDIKDKLTKLMHGYNDIPVDVAELYNDLFGVSVVKGPYKLSAKDILLENISDLESFELISQSDFPLLNKTLIHTFTYLQLRLQVEDSLVRKSSINTKNTDMLSKIIRKAYPDDGSHENTEKRIFLLSRKSLLNEFNHFEIDMNIFQPAIDITNSTLKKERDEILDFIAKECAAV